MSDPGRSTGGRDSQRVTDRSRRISGSGPIADPPSTGSRATSLKAVLLGLSIVALAIVVLVVGRSSDGDDDGQAQPAAASSPPSDPRIATARRDATLPLPRASAIRPAAPPALPAAAGEAAAAIPTSAQDAGAAELPADLRARGHARDGGTAPLVEARHAAPATAARSRSSAVDAGAVAAATRDGEGNPAQPPDAAVPLPPRRESVDRRQRENEAGQVRVARFVEVGGVDLVGRIINIDTGRPVPGISVEARLEGRFVEVETEGDGSFRAPGMVPGFKIVVWIGGRRDRMVSERFDIRIPDNGKKADLGIVRMLEGDEMKSGLDGWIGIYVARKDDKVRVSAVNAWVPANRAGIQVGDAVLSVEGRDVKWLGPRSIAYLLRGPIGSSMTMEVESGDGKRRKLTLTRVTH